MPDAWSYLNNTTGDAWNRLYKDTGDAWNRLQGVVGDAWERLISNIIDVEYIFLVGSYNIIKNIFGSESVISRLFAGILGMVFSNAHLGVQTNTLGSLDIDDEIHAQDSFISLISGSVDI
jgi:hypothetical protein